MRLDIEGHLDDGGTLCCEVQHRIESAIQESQMSSHRLTPSHPSLCWNLILTMFLLFYLLPLPNTNRPKRTSPPSLRHLRVAKPRRRYGTPLRLCILVDLVLSWNEWTTMERETISSAASGMALLIVCGRGSLSCDIN